MRFAVCVFLVPGARVHMWIKSSRSEIVDGDGNTPMPGEFMCHVNMDIDPAKHRSAFSLEKSYINPRLMTLAQG